MNTIKQITETIRNCSENELCYGTLKSLRMIDVEAENLEKEIIRLKKAFRRCC